MFILNMLPKKQTNLHLLSKSNQIIQQKNVNLKLAFQTILIYKSRSRKITTSTN